MRRAAGPVRGWCGRLMVSGAACLGVVVLTAWVADLAVRPAEAADRKPRRTAPMAETKGPADYTSRNFVVHTDLSPDEAKDLLERLETMLGLISTYWGQPNKQPIEMYVVKDLAVWPAGAIPAAGLPKIREGAGVTHSQTLSVGRLAKTTAVVYSVADRGTPQHEAVHAYCAQAFHTTGPLWYSEGMAEMGQYWRKDNASVEIHDIVLQYLQESEPQSLNEIVNGDSTTGDSWENYAWRWALCHLLANNTNYRDRFRPLGLGLLTESGVTFEDVYGSMAQEISFEYLFFIDHIEQGFRNDLCSWNWKSKYRKLRGSAGATSKIEAKRGWQPSLVQVEEGKEYEFAVTGAWGTSKDGGEVTADGGADGKGKLVGIVFKDYQLGEPFELGASGTFTAPSDGNLLLRCQDGWGELADNSGQVSVKVRLKGGK